MVGDYDPAKGMFSYQEYQGSLREESIDGEPRYFRRYIGECDQRNVFLAYMFGWQIATKELVAGNPTGDACILKCEPVQPYPVEAISCLDHDQFSNINTGLNRDFVIVPYAYRIEPHNDEYANPLTSFTGTDPNRVPTAPDQDCLCLIEIEYRAVLKRFPDYIGAMFLEDTPQPSNRLRSDLPGLAAGTFWLYSEDRKLELRKVENRKFRVYSNHGAVFPSTANNSSPPDNAIKADDVGAGVPIIVNEFEVTWVNTPYVPRENIQAAIGKVNSTPFFGSPVQAVLLASADIKPKVNIYQTTLYDIRYRFISRTVGARGETAATSPQAGVADHVLDGRVGIWNRVYWDKPFTGTKQNWWPISEEETAKANTTTLIANVIPPFESVDLLSLFLVPSDCNTWGD